MGTHNSFLGDIGLYSYGMALLVYMGLTGLAVFTRKRSALGNHILVACALTAFWAGAVTVSSLLPSPQILLIQIAELARNAGWVLALLKLLQLQQETGQGGLNTDKWLAGILAAFAAALLAILAAGPFADTLNLSAASSSNIVSAVWLALAILALLLLEQHFRNRREAELWATKHLCIAVGILFVYDIFMYAEALLFQHLDRNFWQARGVVATMAALLMIVSMRRTDQEDAGTPARAIYLSRHVAFHSLTLLASGLYLIAMALAAYFIRYMGGSWGGFLQITFLVAAGMVLIVLLFSGQIRSRARVWLSKNFFSYKYDYRLEWLQFTDRLASAHSDIPQSVVQSIADLARSPAGILWGRTNSGSLVALTTWEMPDADIDMDLTALERWLQAHEWIIDLKEWRASPDMYGNLQLPKGLENIPRAWLILPLFFGDKLQGILLLKESEHLAELNWEDRDLLKVAGRQAATHLAQYQADQALVESRQFEAFNRLSAYVIHDLKNILAQLSLMVSNAEKHKDNPRFVDDMVDTVSNSVDRMTKLMAQLRSETGAAVNNEVELRELLEDVVAASTLREPEPVFWTDLDACHIHCNRERLHAVFGHLIHNAQDATEKSGRVDVRLLQQAQGILVEIIDTGEGMDQEFIQNRLFKPFDSTKGLTGMGIGAFESRDFIRSIGGEISVDSEPGEGSTFRVRIPTKQEEGTREDSPLAGAVE